MVHAVRVNFRPMFIEGAEPTSCLQKLKELVSKVGELFMRLLETLLPCFFKKNEPLNIVPIAPVAAEVEAPRAQPAAPPPGPPAPVPALPQPPRVEVRAPLDAAAPVEPPIARAAERAAPPAEAAVPVPPRGPEVPAPQQRRPRRPPPRDPHEEKEPPKAGPEAARLLLAQMRRMRKERLAAAAPDAPEVEEVPVWIDQVELTEGLQELSNAAVLILFDAFSQLWDRVNPIKPEVTAEFVMDRIYRSGLQNHRECEAEMPRDPKEFLERVLGLNGEIEPVDMAPKGRGRAQAMPKLSFSGEFTQVVLQLQRLLIPVRPQVAGFMRRENCFLGLLAYVDSRTKRPGFIVISPNGNMRIKAFPNAEQLVQELNPPEGDWTLYPVVKVPEDRQVVVEKNWKRTLREPDRLAPPD